MLFFFRLLAVLCAVGALAPLTAARTIFTSSLDAQFVPRLVVRFKSPDSADADFARARVARLARETGVALTYRRTMAVGAHVLTSAAVGDKADAEAAAARLSAHPEVEYAQTSRRMRIERAPNDPMFESLFYLLPGPTTIDATSAWDLTVGSPAVVVAVLDTGSTAHADLVGRLLPGYDMVSNFTASNDGNAKDPFGNARDGDASDPGDWVSVIDLGGVFAGSGCSVENSSWHGTSVMSVVGAGADNGIYTTGVDWNARILPVRVLGKCFGDDTDIADGLAWAGGVPVPAAPINLTPAQVVNLSLGDSGNCAPYFQQSIDAVYARGITRAIVASAGNAANSGTHSPSDCVGVISVGSTTFSGNRAAYSNFGTRVDLMAPGGNSVSSSAYKILALSNTGLTGPTVDSTVQVVGTSFSAPQVSGVVSLMLSVAPDLTAPQIRELLQASAKPFPAGSSCNTSICGAGILDAANAVRQAQATTGATVPVTLVEYYNAALDHYFLTWASAEIALLDAGTTIRGWTRTGKTIKALLYGVSGASAVCRIYIPPGKGDGHYYGRDANECSETMAGNPTFILEDPAFFFLHPTTAGSCAAGRVPVYRVFSNRADANHRYMTDRALRDQMVAQGWLAEGDGADTVVMCAPA